MITTEMLWQGMRDLGMDVQMLPVNPAVPHGNQAPYTFGSVPLHKLAEAVNAQLAAPASLDLLRRLLDDHKRAEPHHAHLCDLCKDTQAALDGAPAAQEPAASDEGDLAHYSRADLVAYVKLTRRANDI